METQKNEPALPDRSKLEIAHIFNQYGHLLGPLPGPVAKVVQNIKECRTQALGGHLKRCDSCGFDDQSYNSCRNRHWPKCQFLSKSEWVEARMSELLPVEYYHMAFGTHLRKILFSYSFSVINNYDA